MLLTFAVPFNYLSFVWPYFVTLETIVTVKFDFLVLPEIRDFLHWNSSWSPTMNGEISPSRQFKI